MLARTLTAQIYRDAAKSGIMETFGEYGDLVEILGRSKVDCGECKPFEGQILSLEGKTKGYTTIAEAREKGLFHPNCIHSFAVTDRVLNIYAPIQVNNNKLGKTDKQIRENSQHYYKEELQGKIFSNPELKNILFSNKGFKKLKSSSADINKLKVLQDVGLGYVKLGQSAPTLSGGEAARVKLAKELQKKPTGKSLFILDEPSTGLHSHDIKKLLVILQRIVDNGDTVIVIEHNLDIIKVADYIIDLGPEGGNLGGNVVCTGTPEEVSMVKESYTGQFLKEMLK